MLFLSIVDVSAIIFFAWFGYYLVLTGKPYQTMKDILHGKHVWEDEE